MPDQVFPGQIPNQLALLRSSQMRVIEMGVAVSNAVGATLMGEPGAFERISDAYALSLTLSHDLNAILMEFEREMEA